MKRRALKVILILSALLVGGLIYAILWRVLGIGLPCVFYTTTGLQCPGCGVSRMCLSLLKLDFKGAFSANPALLCLLPVLLAIGTDACVRYVRTGRCRTKGWSTVLVWISTAILLVFGIIRNIPF